MPVDAKHQSVSARFETSVSDRAGEGLLRERRALQPQTSPRVYYRGRSCLNFCSNDYLGLAGDPRIARALTRAVGRYGVGAGASQLITGYMDVHAELEAALAEYCGYERALVFNSGYMANLGAITALCDRDTSVYMDRLAHASLVDAVLLSRARWRRYTHNDSAALEASLAADAADKKLVMTEGIFSMEGDHADVTGIANVCRSHDALLYLDDAHAFGITGENGRASRSHYHLDPSAVPLMMATFGKALGVSGAFVAGSAGLMETLLQKARTLIYSTAPPPALAAAVLEALTIVSREQWRRDKLSELIDYWRRQAHTHGLNLLDSGTAIQPLIIGANDKALAVSNALLERGILVTAIRPPTVPAGSARLRITLTAAHEKTDVDQLLAALSDVL